MIPSHNFVMEKHKKYLIIMTIDHQPTNQNKNS